jgi:hypothetical protein
MLTSLFVPMGVILAAGVWMGIRYEDPSLRQATAQDVTPPPAWRDSSPAESRQQFPRTYYVGDLLFTPGPGSHAQVDMTPLVDLIRHTIAPGSWRVQDTNGREILLPPISHVRKARDEGGRGPAEPKGAIIPFDLSISLIVRHTAEVHDQVTYLLRYLRENPARTGKTPEAQEERAHSVSLPGDPDEKRDTSSTATAGAQPRPTPPAAPSRRDRLRTLVEQLRRDLEETLDERSP